MKSREIRKIFCEADRERRGAKYAKRRAGALINGAEKDSDEKLLKMVDLGIDFDYVCRYRNYTPLMAAVRYNRIAVAEALIEKGAGFQKEDGNYNIPLHWAAHHCSPEMMEMLIAKGADVNLPDGYGRVPLVFAIWSNDKERVRLLLDKGALLTPKDDQNWSPVDYAGMHGTAEIKEMITAEPERRLKAASILQENISALPRIKLKR